MHRTSNMNTSKETDVNFEWTDEAYEKFGKDFQLLEHNYHKSSLFNDAALIDILDNYPRNRLQCYTMGKNPENLTLYKGKFAAIYFFQFSNFRFFTQNFTHNFYKEKISKT